MSSSAVFFGPRGSENFGVDEKENDTGSLDSGCLVDEASSLFVAD
jgi:hypothetical protein